MSKGDESRATILSTAVRLASQVGIEGITLGGLATELHRSKSGLFAHFASKESLQIATLEFASQRFVEVVIKPSFAEQRGEPRIRSLFERWLAWAQDEDEHTGCVFVSAAAELDDRPGSVRDRLVSIERDWLDTISKAVEIAVKEGHLRKNLDAEQFAFELHAIMLGYHHSSRLLRERDAARRAHDAFARLLADARRRA
jgi:AcrR family transcriptional regulator